MTEGYALLPVSKITLFTFTFALISALLMAMGPSPSATTEPSADQTIAKHHNVGLMLMPPQVAVKPLSAGRGPASVTVKIQSFQELTSTRFERADSQGPLTSQREIEDDILSFERKVTNRGSNLSSLSEATLDELLEQCRQTKAFACRTWIQAKARRVGQAADFAKLSEEEQNLRWDKEQKETVGVAAYACVLGDATSCPQGLEDPSLQAGRGLRLLLSYCDSGSAVYCREAGNATRAQMWMATGASRSSMSNETRALENQASDLFARGCDLGDINSCTLQIQSSSGPADEPRLQSALFQLEKGCVANREPLSYLATCGALSDFYLRAGEADLSKYYRGLGCDFGRLEMCR